MDRRQRDARRTGAEAMTIEPGYLLLAAVGLVWITVIGMFLYIVRPILKQLDDE